LTYEERVLRNYFLMEGRWQGPKHAAGTVLRLFSTVHRPAGMARDPEGCRRANAMIFRMPARDNCPLSRNEGEGLKPVSFPG